MTIVDLINVPSLGDVQTSTDGAQLLYVRNDPDWNENRTVSHVWRVNVDGSDPIQLTNGPRGESSPRWSPDGAAVAFLAERDGAEGTQVYLIRNRGGEGKRLTTHTTSVSDVSWSPDGRWIYFTAPDDKTEEEKARERVQDNVFAFDEDYQHRHLWRVDVTSGGEERVTEGSFTIDEYELSRDGTLVVHSRSPSPLLDDRPLSEVWLMNADGTDARQLTSNGIGESGVRVSPDNSTVAFIADANGSFDFYYNGKLFLMPTSGGIPEVLLPDLPFQVNGAYWSDDGRAIYFRASTGVRQNLFRVEVASRQTTPLTGGDHSIGSWSYEPQSDLHAFSVASPTNAGDIWTLPGAGRKAPTRVTDIFDYITEEFLLPRVEAIQWSGEDGVTVEGLLHYPLDYEPGRRYPLVVQTHGGPASSDRFGFFRSSRYVPVLAALGYMVLKPNYRGSTGYGDAFLRDMVGHYFNQAHKDVMAGVDHLIEMGLVDGERMAKMGWSAGGHMTNKIITYTDRFKAASSGAGAVNWVSMYAQSDVRTYRTPWFGGDPWTEEAPLEQYWSDSPIREAWKITTPTLVLVGENDARVPMPQSVELYRALKANGVPTHLYVAPQQGHGWRELQQRLFKANVELDWFERWVMDRDYEWEKSPVHPGAEEPGTVDGRAPESRH
jgi:dipeptidyl aminopeptidase/acylaminoacyl peptidase